MASMRSWRYVLSSCVLLLLIAACSTTSSPTSVPPAGITSAAPAVTSAPAATSAPAVKKGGVLRMAISADITNSSLILTKPAQWVYQSMFNSLTAYDLNSLDVRPELAESWSVSGDGKVWTFNLRKDVKWVQL